MAISFYSLGAAQEVTGSKHILEVDGRAYLFDCGAFQGKRAEADKKKTGTLMFRLRSLKQLF